MIWIAASLNGANIPTRCHNVLCAGHHPKTRIQSPFYRGAHGYSRSQCKQFHKQPHCHCWWLSIAWRRVRRRLEGGASSLTRRARGAPWNLGARSRFRPSSVLGLREPAFRSSTIRPVGGTFSLSAFWPRLCVRAMHHFSRAQPDHCRLSQIHATAEAGRARPVVDLP